MTREELKNIFPIVTAFLEGKTIQNYDREQGTWKNVGELLSISDLTVWPSDYRIKPESAYRPFKDVEECWNEMQKHQPFGWAKSINNTDPEVFIYCEAITKIDGILTSMDEVPFSYDNMYRNYTFADGTPFGKKEE